MKTCGSGKQDAVHRFKYPKWMEFFPVLFNLTSLGLIVNFSQPLLP